MQLAEYEIPAKIADKIENNNYLILRDHVVWADYGALQVLDKNTGEEKSIHAPGMNGLKKIAAYDEKTIIYKMEERIGSINILSGKNEILCNDCDKYGKFSVCKGSIVYKNINGELVNYDCGSKQKTVLYLSEGENQAIKANCFLLKDQELLYVPYLNFNQEYRIDGLSEEYSDEDLYCYSLQTKKVKRIAKINPDGKKLICGMDFYNGSLYVVFVKNEGIVMMPKVTFIEAKKIDLKKMSGDSGDGSDSNDSNVITLFSADVHSEMIFGSGFGSYHFPYIAYVGSGYGYPAYVYDLKAESIYPMATGCGYTEREKRLFGKEDVFYYVNSCYTVGDYFYYRKGKSHDTLSGAGPLFRIDIQNPQKEVKVWG